MEHKYGSITAGVLNNRLFRQHTACGTETFSFSNGMQTLIETLARTPSVQIATYYKVNEKTRSNKNWKVTATTPKGQRTLDVSQVVVTGTCSPYTSLVSLLDNDLADLFQGIEYSPVNIVHLGFDRSAINHPLDSTGFLVPRNETQKSHQALAGNLWNGQHQARLQAIESHLQQLPGLCLEANYRGGVSVRDRIARSRLVVKQILACLPKSEQDVSLTSSELKPI